MIYYDQRTSSEGFVDYSQTENFVCLEPLDFYTLINYCKASETKTNLFMGPRVIVYVSHPDIHGMHFYNVRTKTTGFVSYMDTDKFICLTNDHMNLLLQYCKLIQF
jgi:hypothetical protein